MVVYGDSSAWIVLIGGTSPTIVGDTNTSNMIDDLSPAEIDLCVVGMSITGTDIPVDTVISYVHTSTYIEISNNATGTTNDVTFTIQDAVYLKTDKQPVVDNADEGVINIKSPGRGHNGFTLITEDVKVKILNSYSITKAKADEIIKGLRALQDSASTAKLRIQVTSGGLYKSFNGVGTTKGNLMPVAIKSFKGEKKLYGGDSTIYEIGIIQLEQIGDLTDTL